MGKEQLSYPKNPGIRPNDEPPIKSYSKNRMGLGIQKKSYFYPWLWLQMLHI